MKIPLKDLAPIVSFVAAFAAPKDTVPALQYVYFGRKSVRAFSGSTGAAWGIPWSIGENVAVPAARLERHLASWALSYDDVEIVVKDERVVMKAGAKSRAQLPMLPAGVEAPMEYILRDAPSDGGVGLDEQFWADLAQVEVSVCKDDQRPIFCGVFWGPGGELVSTDNQRITLCASARKPPLVGGVLIPDHLIRLLGPQRGSFDGAVVDTELWFTQAGGAVHGRLIEGQFPLEGSLKFVRAARAEATAKKNAGTWVGVPAMALAAVFGRVLNIARPPSNRTLVEVRKESVRLSVEEDDGDGQSMEEILPATVAGESIAFHVNAEHFRQALEISSRFWVAPPHAGEKGIEWKPLYVSDAEKRVEHLVALLA